MSMLVISQTNGNSLPPVQTVMSLTMQSIFSIVFYIRIICLQYRSTFSWLSLSHYFHCFVLNPYIYKAGWLFILLLVFYF